MVDPITALAVASTAFNAIKKGFEVGNNLESMAGDIGRWMGALQDLNDAEKRAKNPPLFRAIINKSSVEQEAMQAFAAKQKARQMEDQLREYVKWTHGGDAWEEIFGYAGQDTSGPRGSNKSQGSAARKVQGTVIYHRCGTSHTCARLCVDMGQY